MLGGPAERKAKFVAKTEGILKPGDVINLDACTDWYNLHILVGNRGIRQYQREYFGNLFRWQHNHSMLLLRDNRLLNVRPATTSYEDLANIQEFKVSVYRFTKHELTDADIDVLEEAAQQLSGKAFDADQLARIATNQIMAYPHTIPYRMTDFAKNAKVSAMAVRVCFEKLRKVLEADPDRESFERLFSKFKYDTYLTREQVAEANTECRGVDLESTTPAHFANADEFSGEFKLIAEFDQGRMTYPELEPEVDETPAPAPDAHGHDDHGHDDHAAAH